VPKHSRDRRLPAGAILQCEEQRRIDALVTFRGSLTVIRNYAAAENCLPAVEVIENSDDDCEQCLRSTNHAQGNPVTK